MNTKQAENLFGCMTVVLFICSLPLFLLKPRDLPFWPTFLWAIATTVSSFGVVILGVYLLLSSKRP